MAKMIRPVQIRRTKQMPELVRSRFEKCKYRNFWVNVV
jgi:hypothetical protein